MAKMGRPKVDNPKMKSIGVRMSDEERQKLLEYASTHDMTITEVVQKGVHLLYKQDEGSTALS